MAKRNTMPTRGMRELALFLDAAPARSQQWLADILGVSQPSVSAWLRGASRPEPHLRSAIETLTGIPAPLWETDEEHDALVAAQERIAAMLDPEDPEAAVHSVIAKAGAAGTGG